MSAGAVEKMILMSAGRRLSTCWRRVEDRMMGAQQLTNGVLRRIFGGCARASCLPRAAVMSPAGYYSWLRVKCLIRGALLSWLRRLPYLKADINGEACPPSMKAYRAPIKENRRITAENGYY